MLKKFSHFSVLFLVLQSFLCPRNFAKGTQERKGVSQAGINNNHKDDVDSDQSQIEGISFELAQERSRVIKNVRYHLYFEVLPGVQEFEAREVMEFELTEDVPELLIDFRDSALSEVQINSKVSRAFQIDGDHLRLHGQSLNRGVNRLQFHFRTRVKTQESAILRHVDPADQAEYVYTLSVPADAHSIFPCFDQPDLKGQFQLTIDAPSNWKVITNSFPKSDKTSDETLFSWDGLAGKPSLSSHRHIFEETQPISTYLFAFAAGPFQEVAVDGMEIPSHFYVRNSQYGLLEEHRLAMSRVVREGMNILARDLDYPYPFSKYDLVLIPGFAYGGMEHVGAGFFKEELLLFRSSPSLTDQMRRAILLLHELSHQWFGDLVTMKWFNDVWLKEGFATFLSYDVAQQMFPGWNVWRAFYVMIEAPAYLTDASRGSHPIAQPLGNLKNAKSVYGPIVYNKAPALLRQLKFLLGESNFKKGIQQFLKKFAMSSATSSDLFQTLEESSGRSLKDWVSAWIESPGLPSLRARLSCHPTTHKITQFSIDQKPAVNLEKRGGVSVWPIHLEVLLQNKNHAHSKKKTVTLESESTVLSDLIGTACPDFVYLNSGNQAYGLFLLDKMSLDRISHHFDQLLDVGLKTYLWGALWDSVREAEWDPSQYIRLALKILPREKDDLIQIMVIQNAVTAFNRYLNPKRKAELAAPLEEYFLKNVFHGEMPLEKRVIHWRALNAMVTRESTLKKMDSLLLKKLKIPGMPLQRSDRFRMILALLRNDFPGAPSLFWSEKEQDQTEEGKRLAYVTEAGQVDRAVKNRFMTSYLKDSSIAEDWIQEGVRAFNQSGQSKLTFPFLKQAMAVLPEWKKRRKIFFASIWIKAFVDGQDSQRAIDEIQNFLKTGGLDEDLKLKVLEALDGLERAVAIQKKYPS